MALGLILSGIAFLFLSSSSWLSTSNNLGLKLFALVLLGICQVFFFLPIIPELLETLVVELEIQEGKDKNVDILLNDQTNDLYGILFAWCMFLY